MLSVTEQWLMFASAWPYLAVAAYDGWLHEKARRVPFVEQCAHATIACSLAVLFWALFAQQPQIAVPALGVYAVAAAIDEIRFHGMLARHERMLHFVGYACFTGFALVAYSLGAFA